MRRPDIGNGDEKVSYTANALVVCIFAWHCVRSLRSKPLSRWWDANSPPNPSSLHLAGENMPKLRASVRSTNSECTANPQQTQNLQQAPTYSAHHYGT